MSDLDRRAALKAAVAGATFVPIAAQTGDTSVAAAAASAAASAASQPGDAKRKGAKRPPPPSLTAKPRQGSTPELSIRSKRKQPNQQAAEGPKRFDSEAFQADLKPLYKNLADLKSAPHRLPLVRIDHAFNYRPTGASIFSLIRCDAIAAEAATLIARCLNVRKEWEGLYEAAHGFLLDIERFSRLDAIFQSEESNGLYELDAASSQGEVDAAYNMLFRLEFAAGSIESLLKSTQTNFNEQYAWIQLLGWLSHISGYGHSGNATATVTWNGVSKEVVQYCFEAAVAQGQTQIANMISQLSADLDTRQAQTESIRARLPALAQRAAWDQKNKQFRKLQVAVVRDIYARKQQLISEPGGPLNFTERLDNLQKLFDLLFSDALSRFQSIADGFPIVFQIQSPLPQPILDVISNPGTVKPSSPVLDLAERWLDSIGVRHAQFVQREQLYTTRISLKDLVTKDDWEIFRKSGKLAPYISPAIFERQFSIRLRAISLSVIGVHGSYQGTLQVPPQSFYLHADGTKTSVDQSSTPVIRSGRIAPDDSPRASDRVGMNVIYNCSPFGTWQISLSERTSAREGFKGIDDLILDLVVSAQ